MNRLLLLILILGITTSSYAYAQSIQEIDDVRILNGILDEQILALEIEVNGQDTKLTDKQAQVTIAEANTVLEKTTLILSMVEVQVLLDQVILELNNIQ